MKEMVNSIGETSEKAGYLVGTGTIVAILFGALPTGVAVNLLAGATVGVVGGKLMQKKG